jgi:hypothetical protein
MMSYCVLAQGERSKALRVPTAAIRHDLNETGFSRALPRESVICDRRK